MTEKDEGASKGVIVIIEDDRFLADMYSMKFMQKSFTVEAYASVREALAGLRGGVKPSAILFDIVMPEQDGFDFLRTAKAEKLGEGALFIALTNQSSDADKVQAEKLGADSYVVKASMIPSEVVEMVTKQIAEKKK